MQPSVQEVVTHLYRMLIYKMGHYFLDTQYEIKKYFFLIICIPFWCKIEYSCGPDIQLSDIRQGRV